MDEEERDIQIISDYLDGSLPDEEKRRVEHRLAADTAFKDLFVEIKKLVTGVKSQGREAKKQLLVEFERSQPPIRLGKSRSIWPWVSGIAAAFLTIVLVVYQISFKTGKNDLFQEYYQSYPNVVTPITRGERLDSSLRTNAFIAYELGNYSEAITAFEQISDQSDTIRFYLANSYIGDGQFQRATALLLPLADSSSFRDQSRWYLALAYMKLNNIEQSAAVLEKLKDHSYYGRKAQELLDKLGR